MAMFNVKRTVVRQVHHVNAIDFSDNVSEKDDDESRIGVPPQKYGGPSYRTANSVARRLFLRSAHCVRIPSESTLFSEHTANVHKGPGATEESFELQLAPPSAAPRPFNVSVLAGDDIDREKRMLDKDRKVLLAAINAARYLAKLDPVTIDDEFTERVQSYANVLEDVDVLPAAFRRLLNSPTAQTSVSREQLHSAADNGVRVLSPPGLGAMAVGELWLGGKYKGHGDMFPQHVGSIPIITLPASIMRRINHSAMNYPMVPPTSPFYQTAMAARGAPSHNTPSSVQPSPQSASSGSDPCPDSSPYQYPTLLSNPFTDTTNLSRETTSASLKTIPAPRPPTPTPTPDLDKKIETVQRCECIQPGTATGCGCHLFEVYHILVDPIWKMVGIGRTQDFRWVVEFADGPTDRKKFEHIRGWETIG